MNNSYVGYSRMPRRVKSRAKDRNNHTIHFEWGSSNPRSNRSRSNQQYRSNRSFERARIQSLSSNNAQISRKIISRRGWNSKDRNVRENRRKRYSNGEIGFNNKNSIIRALLMNYRIEWMPWIMNSNSKSKR